MAIKLWGLMASISKAWERKIKSLHGLCETGGPEQQEMMDSGNSP